jgi:hypothetical protein
MRVENCFVAAVATKQFGGENRQFEADKSQVVVRRPPEPPREQTLATAEPAGSSSKFQRQLELADRMSRMMSFWMTGAVVSETCP